MPHSNECEVCGACYRPCLCQPETKTKPITRQAELTEALKDVTIHLIAAHSLLSQGGKKAAGSDKMFKQMLADYENSFERGRVALYGKHIKPLRDIK